MEAKELLNCDAWILDVDGTVVDGRVAYSGKYLIKEELKKLHLGNVYRAIKGAKNIEMEVERITKEYGKLEADNFGLAEYHRILRNAKISKIRVENATCEYIKKHNLAGINELLFKCKYEMGIPLFFSSTSSEWHIGAVNRYFRGSGYFANPVDTDGLVKIVTKTPEDKVSATMKMMGVDSLENCVVFGDSPDDLIFKKYGAKFVSSPLSPPDVRKVADISLDSYEHLLTAINKLYLL